MAVGHLKSHCYRSGWHIPRQVSLHCVSELVDHTLGVSKHLGGGICPRCLP